MENTQMMRRTGIHVPDALRFVESDDGYSVYRRRSDGEEVYLAHGTGKVLVPYTDLDVEALWAAYVRDDHQSYTWGAYVTRERFLENLRTLTIEPDEVDNIDFCSECYSPDTEDELTETGTGNQVCESCLEDYYSCDSCDHRFRETTTTLSESEICSGCLNNNYSYCSHCEGYYHDEYGGDHSHDGSGCCESPDQSFTIRNDGDAPLDNDTRVTVTLPAGVISDEGLMAIARAVRDYGYTLDDVDAENKMRLLSYGLHELGDQWQTRDGNYAKRLSRHAYKQYGIKITPEIMSRVGCIARDHSTAVDFQIEITRDLNLSAYEFAHEESCWWQSYSSSRCALKTNGGFGIRTFCENAYGNEVTGRAWVMPLRRDEHGRMTPTFDTQGPDAFVVFNGYGDLSGYVAARIMSHMAGMTYRKIGFSCSPMYVNSDSGYLIAPEEIAEKYTDGSLYLSVEQHSDLFTNEKKVLAHAA